MFIFYEFEPYSHSVDLHDALSIGFPVFRQDPNLSHTKMNGNAETFDTSPISRAGGVLTQARAVGMVMS